MIPGHSFRITGVGRACSRLEWRPFDAVDAPSAATGAEPDFRAFDCPNVFVVGYGMDVAYRYRELPFVGRIAS